MGRPRFLPRRLTLLALFLAACGGDGDLLVPRDLAVVYSGGGGSGKYRMDPGGGAPGKIVGRVRFEGAPWQPRKLDLTTQDGFCVNAHGAGGLLSEDFQLGADGGLGDVIVYLKEGLTGGKWDPPKEPVVLDQLKCQYIPHVAVVQIGQPLVIKSSDNITHNVHGANGPNPEFNHAMARAGELPEKYLRKPEVAKRIYCDVHNWMVSWLAVLPHPFHAVTGADGSFTIENVPPGTYPLAAWHERAELGEKAVDVTVKPGETVEVDLLFQR
jgi:hypothetical protein